MWLICWRVPLQTAVMHLHLLITTLNGLRLLSHPLLLQPTLSLFLLQYSAYWCNPRTIVSDNGPQFLSTEFAAFLKDSDIKHIRTAVYHPAANAAIKRFLRVLRASIQSAILQQKPWKATVTESLQVYRATPHPSSCCMAEKCAHSSMSFLRR